MSWNSAREDTCNGDHDTYYLIWTIAIRAKGVYRCTFKFQLLKCCYDLTVFGNDFRGDAETVLWRCDPERLTLSWGTQYPLLSILLVLQRYLHVRMHSWS